MALLMQQLLLLKVCDAKVSFACFFVLFCFVICWLICCFCFKTATTAAAPPAAGRQLSSALMPRTQLPPVELKMPEPFWNLLSEWASQGLETFSGRLSGAQQACKK